MGDTQTPTVGRILHYKLSAENVKTIETHRRVHGGPVSPATAVHSVEGGKVVADGYEYPLIVTRVHEDGSVNGQVFLDSDDQLWVHRAKSGESDGQWSWPVKA